MGYYDEIYLKRLNRYGMDYNSRIQTQREREFELYLLKVSTRVEFDYENETIPASLERSSQNETKTLAYLLTRRNILIPNGTVLMIPNDKGVLKPWMIYWLEDIKASGYNKYIVLKMTHFIEWKDREGNIRSTWSYLYGQEDNMLKDELRSRSRSDVLYTENLKMSFFIMPTNKYMKKDDYFTITVQEITEGYRVTGYDILSNPGVEFVTVDPVYLRDESPIPEKTPEDSEEDFFWIRGGQ